MPLVKVPKPKFIDKLRRFFLVDLLKGLGLTLKYNIGAATDKDAVAAGSVSGMERHRARVVQCCVGIKRCEGAGVIGDQRVNV